MSYSNLIWRSVAVLLLFGVGGSAMMLAPAGDPPVDEKKSDTPLSVKPEPKAVPMIWKEREPIKVDGWLAASLDFSANGQELRVGGNGQRYMGVNLKTRKIVHTLMDEEFDTVSAMKNTKWYSYMKVLSDESLGIDSWAVTLEPNGHIEQHLTGGIELTRKAIDGGTAPDDIRAYVFWDHNQKRGVCFGTVDATIEPNIVWAWSGNIPKIKPTMDKLIGHKNPVVCAAWSKDGSTIVTGDDGGTIIVWDGNAKESKRFTIGKDRICSVDVSADGKRIAAATIHNEQAKYTENVYVWDVENPPKPLKPIALPKEAADSFIGVAGIKFTPDGKTLAATFCNFDQLKSKDNVEGQVRLWDLQQKK